jgi:hypothetical protein
LAIWSEDFPDDHRIEDDPAALNRFIDDRRDRLDPRAVFLGTNPSSELPPPFANFHWCNNSTSRRNVARLEHAVQDGSLQTLQSTYMTDASTVAEADVGNVRLSPSDIDDLCDRLSIFDEPVHHVICCGGDPFETAVRRFKGTRTRTEAVTDLPANVEPITGRVGGKAIRLLQDLALQQLDEELPEQLALIDNRVANTSEQGERD